MMGRTGTTDQRAPAQTSRRRFERSRAGVAYGKKSARGFGRLLSAGLGRAEYRAGKPRRGFGARQRTYVLSARRFGGNAPATALLQEPQKMCACLHLPHSSFSGSGLVRGDERLRRAPEVITWRRYSASATERGATAPRYNNTPK